MECAWAHMQRAFEQYLKCTKEFENRWFKTESFIQLESKLSVIRNLCLRQEYRLRKDICSWKRSWYCRYVEYFLGTVYLQRNIWKRDFEVFLRVFTSWRKQRSSYGWKNSTDQLKTWNSLNNRAYISTYRETLYCGYWIQ